ncbi:aldo/keto reductase [Halococcus saccharolyticus DSM 5350]|uniref:Aldo/keto reductase n=2 Tax=Halococcus saccharolyticus TaxID=62319 RepID=M0MGY7_9EURY|nr:aldo/keto reductase [Halococcus saccharolyticus]EMA44976.1 aldo/keto reductase [Halococcus saccharolyticus DSM 5350]
MVDTDMEYTRLGDTGLEVSRLCLGCMNFGSDAPWMIDDREQSEAVIERAIEHGINFFDTANVYSRGESEEILGDALDGRRDEHVIATKVHGRMANRPNGQGLSRRHVLEQADASLDRLGTDYIDLYQIHRWDDETPITETLSALDTLVDHGKVRYVGASTMSGWQFTKALYEADVNNFERFVSMQAEYNLVDRHEEANVLPVCRDQNVGVVPWSPLAGGFLTGKYERGEDPTEGRAADDEHTRNRFTEDNWAVLDEVRALADEKETTPVGISLAWLLAKDVVDAPIVGPRTVEHLDEQVAALSVSLSDDEIERLEAPKTPVWSREIGDV